MRTDHVSNGAKGTSTQDNVPKESSSPARKAPEFDPDQLRLPQNFAATAGVKRLMTTIPVRKPNRHEFVRVHAAPEMRLDTAVLIIKEQRDEVFIVDRSLWQSLGPELQPIALFVTISRQGVLFLWPVKLPRNDGRHDSWSASALEAAHCAMTRWTRCTANMALGAYDVCFATGDLPDPEWPADLPSFAKILEIAFRERFIGSADHLAIRKLRGEV